VDGLDPSQRRALRVDDLAFRKEDVPRFGAVGEIEPSRPFAQRDYLDDLRTSRIGKIAANFLFLRGLSTP
jgi:hypothetical protein